MLMPMADLLLMHHHDALVQGRPKGPRLSSTLTAKPNQKHSGVLLQNGCLFQKPGVQGRQTCSHS